MSKFSRLPTELQARLDRLLSGDSTDADLDRAHEKLRAELRNVEQGITDVATERERLNDRIEELREEVERHNKHAREAVANDEDEIARESLTKKRRKLKRIERLEGELQDLEAAEEELLERRDDLAERVEEFHTRKEQLKSRKRAAEAKADALESATGNDEEASRKAESAREDVRDAEARAAAMDELREEGVFDGPLSSDDPIQDELDEMDTERTVDAELDTIKQELGDEDPDEGDDRT